MIYGTVRAYKYKRFTSVYFTYIFVLNKKESNNPPVHKYFSCAIFYTDYLTGHDLH